MSNFGFISEASPPQCEDCENSGMVCVGENNEDFCVCEFGHALSDEFYAEPCEMSDVEADADTLASIGWGTDEDYGMY